VVVKFIDGTWLVPDDLAVMHPLDVTDVRSLDGKLVAHVAIKQQRTRGDQLNAGVFTLTLSSPREGIIGVRLEHFQGVQAGRPNFELNTAPTNIRIRETDDVATLESGRLAVSVPHRGPFRLDFLRDGVRITGSVGKSAGRALERGSGLTHTFEGLDLSVGENVYGLGERFGAFVKNGQVVEIWNRDGGTSTDQAYKNIPFFLTSEGWGVFVDHPGRVEFEVASERSSKVQFSVPGERLEYYLIDGPSPKQVLTRYTALTGRPALPPPWSFGLWLTTSFTTSYDEATVNSFVDGMQARDIPLSVFHFDCFWMRGRHWCDFEWDPEVFPDPPAMLARLKGKGLKICLWINPYISQLSPLFAEGMAKGYLLRRPDGSVWQWDLWQPGQGIVDFTNPAACDWYGGHLRRLLRMGVDCFKTDFGERIPTEVVWSDGSSPEGMHNYYAYLYNRVVFDVLREERGEGEAVLFARSASVGSQKLPVHWGGDCESSYESMAESLRGGLSLGLSGFGFWSHDIGGFEGTAPAHLYKRWCAFGLLSSHSRLHGSDSYRVPWLFDEEAVDVLRFFTKLKWRLMPYLFATAVEATQTGVPTMRAMLLEFPEDPGVIGLDRQYMLGGSLLVAPVFREDGQVTFYLPDGRWTNLLTNEVLQGGWHKAQYNFMGLPLFVRENTLLAQMTAEVATYDLSGGVTLELYQLGDGMTATATIPDATGRAVLTVCVERHGRRLVASATGTLPWQLLLVGAEPQGALPEGHAVTARGILLPGRDGLEAAVF
jgi:alpha-D-xyloside xylohydrolase